MPKKRLASPIRTNKEQKSESSFVIKNGSLQERAGIKLIQNRVGKLLHMAAIIDSTDDAVISKSINGTITSWNKGAQKLYGYTAEEIIGKPISLLIPPNKKNDFPYIINQLKEGKQVDHYETQRLTKDGRVIDVSITVSPIYDSRGKLIGASKIARDISERIEYEKKRQEFAHTVTHELKNPLTSIKILVELLSRLADKKGDQSYQPYIKKINKQIEKSLRIINDFSDASLTRSGGFVLNKKPFDLAALMEEIVDDMQAQTKHRILFDKPKKQIINGDRERIGQVLTNLISNAIKYSPAADKIIITARLEAKDVIIGVEDFGIGIPKKYHKKIFERYFRIDNKSRAKIPGVGIGLDFSSEMIKRHGGNIWVKGKKDGGSIFYISLPYL